MNKKHVTIAIESIKQELTFGTITHEQATQRVQGMITLTKPFNLSEFIISEYRRLIK